MSDQVRIVEVGPRDGLQNEKAPVSVEGRVAFIEALLAAGLHTVEVGAFVSPKAIPQMAGSDEVLRRVSHLGGGEFHVLVPNEKGYEAARAAGAKVIAVFGSASEGFSRANINCSVAESIERFKPVIARARADGVKVRGYISCVLGCPYDGEIKPQALQGLAVPSLGTAKTITETLRLDAAQANVVEVVAYNGEELISTPPLRINVDAVGATTDNALSDGWGTLTLTQDGADVTAVYSGDSAVTGTLFLTATTATTAIAEANQTMTAPCTVPISTVTGGGPSPTPMTLPLTAGSLALVGSTLFVSFTGTMDAGSACPGALLAAGLICSKQ